MLEFLLVALVFCPGQALLPEKDYKLLPTLYEIGNYDECIKQNKIFCRADVLLKPIDNKNVSLVWNLIQETAKHNYYYDHAKLRRTICVRNKNDRKAIEKYQEKYDKTYAKDGLKTRIENIECVSEENQKGITDYLFIIIVITIASLVFLATKEDWVDQKEKKKDDENKIYRKSTWLSCFSIIQNWKTLTNTKRKYETIEGLRTYTMCTVVFFHNVVTFVSTYLENPEFIEGLFENKLILLIFSLSMFTVQIFFTLSAFFLSLQIMTLYEKNKEFTLKDAILVVINRYIRLFGPLLMITLSHMISFNQLLTFGVQKQFVQAESEKCYESWYQTLFLQNTWFSNPRMCAGITWYVAVDFELYLLSTFIFYFIFKFKWNKYKVILSFLTITILGNILWNYINEYEVVHPVSPRSYAMVQHTKEYQFNSVYLSTYSNAASYFVGLLFGILSVEMTKRTISDSAIGSFLWLFGSFGLPLIPIFLTLFTYSRILTAILSATVKPFYAFCNGILILGLIFDDNLPLKSMLSWKPVVLLANFSYSTYLFHFAPVLAKISRMFEPLHLNSFIVVISLIYDILASYLIGILAYFVFEAPSANLQKRYVPTVKKRIESENGKCR